MTLSTEKGRKRGILLFSTTESSFQFYSRMFSNGKTFGTLRSRDNKHELRYDWIFVPRLLFHWKSTHEKNVANGFGHQLDSHLCYAHPCGIFGSRYHDLNDGRQGSMRQVWAENSIIKFIEGSVITIVPPGAALLPFLSYSWKLQGLWIVKRILAFFFPLWNSESLWSWHWYKLPF